ncbi:MAG TPA: protease pro-enzyme activation domain-containing protein [Verrucomicrobiae bacterium]
MSAGLSHAEGQQILSGHVPAALTTLHLQSVGMLTNTAQLKLAIGLPLRNSQALDVFLKDVYNPASPNYRHFLTPDQFADNFGPTVQDYQAVIDFARTNGLTVIGTYSNRMVLGVSGKVSDIETAFHTTLQEYQHPTENRKFYAPSSEPVVGSSLPILHVQGLDNYTTPQPMSYKVPAGTQPASGTGPGGAYMGQDFRNAYLPGVDLDGSGQTIGLLQFDGYAASDIQQYEGLAGLPNVTLENVLLDGFDGSAGVNNGEVCLDIEASISMAPGIDKVVVFEGFSPDSILSSMASRPEIKQFSASWGYSVDATTDQLYKQLAAQGQTFLNASGDGDAWLGPIPYGCLEDTNITLVGGTTLTMNGAGKTYVSEKAWNWGKIEDSSAWNPDGYWGTSGGISTRIGIPFWQQGIDMTASGGSTTMRNVPDVALTADNVFVVSSGGEGGAFGGTSCASPLFAGVMALVNQQAASTHNPPVGFLAPAAYTIAQTSTYTNCFHDIVTGDNTWDLSPTKFPAVAGYDLCTGLGTPNGLGFITALSGLPPRNGYLQLSVDPVAQSALINGSTQTVFVTVNDVYGVTNATVTGFLTDGTAVVFVNDGTSPDVVANNSVYSGSFAVPASGTSLTLTISASAPDEIGITNVLSYALAPLPLNDNFTNAAKIPTAGGTYISNNRFATREANEPALNTAASLWWSWTPVVTTNVLLNTIGSKVDNVLAVYTGSTLVSLQTVATTNSALSQFKPAQVIFNVTAGITYKIAVSSASSNSLGTVGLRAVLAGKPDTNAPSVSIASLQSGATVTNRVLIVTGSASDSGANATGVNQVFVSVNGNTTVASGTTSWSAIVGLQAGINYISASAVDNAGNFYTLPTTIQVVYLVPVPANDFFTQSTVLTGTSGTISADSTDASKETGEPDHAGNAGGASLWWSFVPSADGVLTLNTTNSTFDTVMGLYTGNNVSDLTTVASDDDAYDGVPGGFSLLEQAVKAGTKYYIAIDGFDGAKGGISLSYSFVPGVVHLISVTNAAGGIVQLSTTNSLGGISILPGMSAYIADGAAVTLTAIPNDNTQFDIWGGNTISLENPLVVIASTNINFSAVFDVGLLTDGFESGNLARIAWSTAGNAPWFVQTNVVDQGSYSVRSGNIGDNQTSSLILTTNFSAGIGSFDYRISSEQLWDFLNFYVDGQLIQKWSGELPWANYSFSLSAGMHTLKWVYAKDPSDASGLDAAFIDNVILPVLPAKNSSTSAQLQLKRQTDGQFYVNLQGQPNQLYIVQISTNLVDWSSVSTNIANGGAINIPLPANGTADAQFYRAVTP